MFKQKDETYRIIGACMEVHKELGTGFTEIVYQEALEVEFLMQNIPYLREPVYKIQYKKVELKKTFKPDFVCFEDIIIELKSAKSLVSEHVSQVLNYLNATKYDLALLVNFGCQKLEFKRIVL